MLSRKLIIRTMNGLKAFHCLKEIQPTLTCPLSRHTQVVCVLQLQWEEAISLDSTLCVG